MFRIKFELTFDEKKARKKTKKLLGSIKGVCGKKLSPVLISSTIVLSLVLALGINLALAWQPPTAVPPLDPVAAPINVSGTRQDKTGAAGFSVPAGSDLNYGLTVGSNAANGLKVDTTSWFGGRAEFVGNMRLTGTYADIDFNETDATDMNYRIRQNSGDLRFQTCTDAWTCTNQIIFTDAGNITVGGSSLCRADGTNCPAGSGAWATNATHIYNTNTGNVGIGTAAPAFKLDVAQGNQARIGDVEIGDWPANNAYAYFGHQALDHSATGNYALLQNSTGYTYLNAASTRNIYFRINNVDRMILDSAGNVGIGTTAPSEDLHVYRADTDVARIYATGTTQGTGMVYVGQSPTYGGGITYDGDNNPVSVGTTDHVSLFRRTAGVDTEVMHWAHNSNNVTMPGQMRADGGFGVDGGTAIDANNRYHYTTNTSTNKWGSVNASGFGIDALNSGDWDFLVYENAIYLQYSNPAGSVQIGGAIYDYNDAIVNIGESLAVASNLTVVGNVGVGTTAPTRKLDVRGTIRQTTNTTYDVWIQGGASNAGGDDRNLAFLGVDEDSGDYLWVNFNGEYAGGTRIGGAVTMPNYATCTLKTNASGVVTCGTDSVGAGDNLGNHTATQALNMSGRNLLNGAKVECNALENPSGTVVNLNDHLQMSDNNIWDANTIQANTILDPEDAIININDNITVGNRYVRGSYFLDDNNTARFVDPSGTSQLQNVTVSGEIIANSNDRGSCYWSGIACLDCNTPDPCCTLYCNEGHWLAGIQTYDNGKVRRIYCCRL